MDYRDEATQTLAIKFGIAYEMFYDLLADLDMELRFKKVKAIG